MNTAPSPSEISRVRRRLIVGRPVTEVMVDGTWTRWEPRDTTPWTYPQAWRSAIRAPGRCGCRGPGRGPAAVRPGLVPGLHARRGARDRRVQSDRAQVLPGPYRAAALYEQITRSTFPMFKPNALWYEQPIYYMSNALTFVPTDTTVAAPAYADSIDYELELGVVLNKPLRDATTDEAHRAIGGYVVLNDFSARNVQLREMRSGFGPQKAKHFLSSMSADIVVAENVDPEALNASVSINGHLVTTSTTQGPTDSVAEALAFASRAEQLYPGELFGTGTLPGCSGIQSGHALRPGDRLELQIDGIGTTAPHHRRGPSMKIEQVAGTVHMVTGTNVNWALITDGDALTVIDAGYPNDGADLLRSIHVIGHKPQDVQAVLLTHAHLDHMGGIPTLLAEHTTVVLTGPAEVAHAHRDYVEHGEPGPDAATVHEKGQSRLRVAQTLRAVLPHAKMSIPTAAPAPFGEQLDLPGAPIPVSTPGHTTGHQHRHSSCRTRVSCAPATRS